MHCARQVRGAADVGFFIDAQNFRGDATQSYPTWMQQIYTMQDLGGKPTRVDTGSSGIETQSRGGSGTGSEFGLNADCLRDHADAPHKCFLAPVARRYVKTPNFLFNSKFDSWQLNNELQVSTWPSPPALNTPHPAPFPLQLLTPNEPRHRACCRTRIRARPRSRPPSLSMATASSRRQVVRWGVCASLTTSYTSTPQAEESGRFVVSALSVGSAWCVRCGCGVGVAAHGRRSGIVLMAGSCPSLGGCS